MNMMAPEILKGKIYNEECDLWSLGIIIYILYLHKYPYKGATELAILNNIKNNKDIIEKQIDNSVLKDLVKKLLNQNPSERLNWDNYFNHSFFQIKKKENEVESIKQKNEIEIINQEKELKIKK